MSIKPDKEQDEDWYQLQEKTAVIFGLAFCFFLANMVGIITYLVSKDKAVGIFVGIGTLACLLRITFKDWND